jgi:hypothetical protein
MIVINKKWSVSRDQWQWILHESITTRRKDGTPKVKIRHRYYPWLDQAMRAAAEADCEGVKSFKEVEEAYLAMTDAFKDAVGARDRVPAEAHARLLDAQGEVKRLQAELKRARMTA